MHLGLFKGIDDPICRIGKRAEIDREIEEIETKTKNKYMDTRGGGVWRLGLIHMQY